MAAGLVACPFCREMFQAGEHAACPECGVALVETHKLPKTHAELEEEAARIPPDERTLPLGHVGHGRGALLALAGLGLAAFFLPWVRETAPEREVLTGYDMARRLGWMWAPGVSWFVLIPLVLSRRSVARMRGARVAVAFLAAMALATVVVRVAQTPSSTALRTVRFTWGEGLWATGAIALAVLAVAAIFGGRATPAAPTVAPPSRPPDAPLH